MNYIWGEDTTRELSEYMESPRSFLTPEGKFLKGTFSDMIDLMMIQMTYQNPLKNV